MQIKKEDAETSSFYAFTTKPPCLLFPNQA